MINKETLIALIDQKMYGRDIAKNLNVSWTEIRYFAKQNNIDISNIVFNPPQKNLTEEEINDIIQKYENADASITQLAKQYGVDRKKLSILLKDRGIVIRKDGKKPVDSFYFNKINTPEKAYWLGFLYADGYIQTDKEKQVLEVALQAGDIKHLEKIKNAMKSKHKISRKTVNVLTADGKFFSKSAVRFSVHDLQLCEDLKRLGCIPNKSLILQFPTIKQVPVSLMSHFIRGYFDGDGCISFHKRDNGCTVDFTCGSIDFAKELVKFIFNKIGVTLHIYKNRSIFQVAVTKRNELTSFLKYIYKNSTENTRLDRKYEKALKFL